MIQASFIFLSQHRTLTCQYRSSANSCGLKCMFVVHLKSISFLRNSMKNLKWHNSYIFKCRLQLLAFLNEEKETIHFATHVGSVLWKEFQGLSWNRLAGFFEK